MKKIENTHIQSIDPLLSPDWLKHQHPITAKLNKHVYTVRQQIERIIQGKDPRVLVIVGPCSVHDPAAIIDYAKRLHRLSRQVEDSICVVMRTYFEKPRTSLGWKGFINDPYLDESYDINTGLTQARKLLFEINALGLGVATEFLDTITPQYIADLVSWAAIGARTTESQVHRNLSSGLSMPVGFKNSTTGNISIAIDAIKAAANPHHFLSITDQGVAAIVRTYGNPNCHIVLRGGSESGPNYHAANIQQAQEALISNKLNPSIMVDCSHGNSQKDYHKQSEVLRSISAQIVNGSEHIIGVMLESFIEPGNQKLTDKNKLQYGKSITDACIGWDETEKLICEFAKAIGARISNKPSQ